MRLHFSGLAALLLLVACQGGRELSSDVSNDNGQSAGPGTAVVSGPRCRADAGGSNAVDCATVAGTIVPPGTDFRHAHDEIPMYDNLVYGYPELTQEQLIGEYFKDGGFHPEERYGVEREYSPKSGVTIKRDARWGIPVVYGDTDNDAFFGAGFVTAEDRLTVMELLRALGRAEAFAILDTAAGWLADAEMLRLYPYTPAELDAQIDRVENEYGEAGVKTREAVQAFVDGINTYITGIYSAEIPLPNPLAELGITPAPWVLGDVVAAAMVVRAMFGADGGAELSNASKMLSLFEQFGAADARKVYDDFRNRNNQDAPIHVTNSQFVYMQRDEAALDAAANTLGVSAGDPGLQVLIQNLFPTGNAPEAKQLQQQFAGLYDKAQIKWHNLKLNSALGTVDLSRPGSMSNAMIVGGSRTDNGRPLMIGGPQTGYFSPQILFELELHGETLHTRGAGFPGLSFAPVIGRAGNYAWTATAGGSDMVDSFIEILCEPEGGTPNEQSRHYLHEGECKPMEWWVHRSLDEVQQGTVVPELEPVLGEIPLQELPLDQIPTEMLSELGITDLIVERTVHGPVVSRGVLTGTDGAAVPIAVVRARTTLFKEADGAVALYLWATGHSKTADQFREDSLSMNLSTNWMYINETEIAYYHGGLFPERLSSVDPDFPVMGTGPWDWQGLREQARHPQASNPKRDYIVSWNNKHSPGWGAADTKWNFSSLYRADMLEDKILREGQAGRTMDAVRLTQLMEEAGLTDFRGSHVLPLVMELLQAHMDQQPSELAGQWLPVLTDWVSNQSLRRDGDQDGNYDRGAAVSFMDAFWSPLIDAVFTFVDIDSLVGPRDNAPGATGSAYQDGHYGHVWTQLTMALGKPLKSPTQQAYCGADALGESPAASVCAARVWAAFDAAAQALGDPAGVSMAREDILFIPVPDASADLTPMHWVNRPTYQQVMGFK
ncbi:MAG: penicillin acylase family protein [Oceanococcus sp.]